MVVPSMYIGHPLEELKKKHPFSKRMAFCKTKAIHY
jgi:hypothetical protein